MTSLIFLRLVFFLTVFFSTHHPYFLHISFSVVWSIFPVRSFPQMYGNLLIFKNKELKSCLEVVGGGKVSWMMDFIVRWFHSAVSLLDPWLSILLGLCSCASQIPQRRDFQSPTWLLALWEPNEGISEILHFYYDHPVFRRLPLHSVCQCLPVQRSSASPLQKINLSLRHGVKEWRRGATDYLQSMRILNPGLNWFFNSLANNSVFSSICTFTFKDTLYHQFLRLLWLRGSNQVASVLFPLQAFSFHDLVFIHYLSSFQHFVISPHVLFVLEDLCL